MIGDLVGKAILKTAKTLHLDLPLVLLAIPVVVLLAFVEAIFKEPNSKLDSW